MKKLISMLLVLTMVLSLVGGASLSAFATGDDGSQAEITGTVGDDNGNNPQPEESPAPTPEQSAATPSPAPVDPDDGDDQQPGATPSPAPVDPDDGDDQQPEATPSPAPVNPDDGGAEPGDGENPPAKPEGETDENGEKKDPPAKPEGETEEGGEKKNPPTELEGETEEGGDEGGTEPDESDASTGYAKTDSFVGGKVYIIGIEQADGTVLAMYNDNGTIKAVEADLTNPDSAILWTASSGKGQGLGLVNGSFCLLYGDGSVKTRGSDNVAGNWAYASGTLTYDKSGTKYTVGAVSGDSFTCGTSVTAATIVLYTAGSVGDVDEEEPTETTLTGTIYDKANEVGDGYAVFVVNGYTFSLSKGQKTYTAVTVSDDKSQASAVDGAYVKTVAVDGGFRMVVNDPPDKTVYIYLDADGNLANTDMDAAAPEGYWVFAHGLLSYVNGDTTYYVTNVDASGVTVSTAQPRPDTATAYTGTSAPSKGGTDKPDSKGDGDTTTTDAQGPTFVVQPAAAPYAIEGSGYAAPTYTATATPAEGVEGVTAITFQWFVGDKDHPISAATTVELDENGQATSSIAALALQNLEYGVYLVYCQATCTIDGEEHSSTSNEAAFIVAKGVQDNTFLTFSDVHETFTNISYAINDTVTVYGGFIPALIICTGDWANSYYSEFKAATEEEQITFKETTYTDYIQRMTALVGGIDIVFVSGNHDNAAAAVQANQEAGLGVADTRVIYDNTDSNPGANLGSSANSDDLVVYGINYTDISVGGGFSYVNILPDLEDFLQGLVDKDFDGVVVISAHAGLHALTVDEMSTATEDGDNDYNIDQSDDMVTLLNKYAEKGLTIMFLFGHDHSKGESEFSKVAGDTIVSYNDYKAGTKTTQTVKFAYYGHSGYITDKIQGSQKYTVVEYDGNSILSLENADSADLRTKVSGKATALPDANTFQGTATTTATNATVAEDNYAGAKLNLADEALLKAVLNEDIQMYVAAGATVEVQLQAEELALTDTQRKDIQAKAAKQLGDKLDNLNYGIFLDITLTANVGDQDIPVTQTNGDISLTIDIPKDLQNDSYTYKILRLHDGDEGTEATLLDTTKDGQTLTFKTDRFSTYILMYEIVSVDDPQPDDDNQGNDNQGNGTVQPDNSNQGNDNQGNGTVQPDNNGNNSNSNSNNSNNNTNNKQDDTAKKTDNKAPKTGDDSNIALWSVVLVVCAVSLVAVVPKKKRN